MTPAEKIAAYALTDTHGCLVWQRATNSRGYGLICFDGKVHLAHRVAWELTNGPIPADLQIDHLCRNKKCVRLDHLELVTARENNHRKPSTHADQCKYGHAMVGDNLRVNARGMRSCRRCVAVRAEARRWCAKYLDRDLTRGELADWCRKDALTEAWIAEQEQTTGRAS